MHYLYSKEEFSYMMLAAGEKLAANIPFCILRLPDREELTQRFVLIAPQSEDDNAHRVLAKVKPWLSSRWYDFSTSAEQQADSMPVCPESTPKERYEESLAELIDILKRRGGKTVICRNICGRFNDFDLAKIFESYLGMGVADNCVTFLLWHPAMNFWMGSTPELILERCNNGTFRTIALAGTRSKDICGAWDMKNLEEHNIVVNDIESRLRHTGLDFFRKPIKELTYGPVSHLLTEIVSKFVENGHERRFFDSVADEIQPTPALAGYPRPYAISEIERFESWPRFLYAGCLNIAEIRLNMTYGIIRCVHFDTEKWSIYTGSGVTADSFPSVEWEETKLKAAPLVECLKKI